MSPVSTASFGSTDIEMAPIIHSNEVIIRSFLYYNAIGLIFYSTDLFLGICWLSQNLVGSFCWMGSIIFYLQATFVIDMFDPYYLGVFCGLIYFCLANRLYLVMLFIRKKRVLYLVSTWFVVTINCSKRQMCILEY